MHSPAGSWTRCAPGTPPSPSSPSLERASRRGTKWPSSNGPQQRVRTRPRPTATPSRPGGRWPSGARTSPASPDGCPTARPNGRSTGPTGDFMELQKYLWNPLMDYWFRMEIEGWEKIPEPPALLIGIHSGAPFVWDAWTIGVQWWRHFGRVADAARDRPRRAHGAARSRTLLPPDGRGAGRARQHRLGAGRRS